MPTRQRSKPTRSSRYVLEKRVRACRHALFDVYFDRISAPDGQRVERFLVVSPKARNARGITGVAVLPVMNGRFGLLKLYRHPVAREVWEIPRGFVDGKERAHDAAARELREETGLVCRARNLMHLGNTFPEAGVLAAEVGLFIARVAPGAAPAVGAEFGHRELRFVSEREFVRMIGDGRIKDPTTMLAYYRYAARSRRRPSARHRD